MATAPASGAKILVVEDNEIVREGTAFVLRREGYNVATAVNGREALDLLALSEPPNLILLDMIMPVCDGWQFMEQWRRFPTAPLVPVIIMSSLGVAGLAWARSLGAVDFLRLPADPQDLLTVLRRHLVSS